MHIHTLHVYGATAQLCVFRSSAFAIVFFFFGACSRPLFLRIRIKANRKGD